MTVQLASVECTIRNDGRSGYPAVVYMDFSTLVDVR